MGVKRVILEPQIVDPNSLKGAGWDDIEAALRRFEKASADVDHTTVRRMDVRSRADRAILGYLLLKARDQYALNASSLSENNRLATLQDGERKQQRIGSGRFKKSGDGFLSWLIREFPGISQRSVYNYMYLAQNVGLTTLMSPLYVLSPAAQFALRRPQKQLYLNPCDFQDLLKKERISGGKEPNDQAFEQHLYLKTLMADMQISFSEVRFALTHAPVEDCDAVESFFQESLNIIRGIRKGRLET
jgi:hypothetical protein